MDVLDINESIHTSGSDLKLDPFTEAGIQNRRARLTAEEVASLLQPNPEQISKLQLILQTATSLGYTIAVLKALMSSHGVSPDSVGQALELLTEINLEALYE